MGFHEDVYLAIKERFHNNNNEEIEEFIKKVIKHKNNLILDEGFFKWIKDSERACYWLWNIINSTLSLSLWTNSERSDYIYCLRRVCVSFKYSPDMLTHKLRYKHIVDCVDSIYGEIDAKKRMLNELKCLWIDVYNNSGVLKWLNRKNKEQLEWMLSYIQGYADISNMVKSLPVRRENNQEYLDIYACYDAWNASKEAKELFRNKASRAWSQMCLRSRMEKEDRVALNAYITIDARNKLKELSKVNKLTLGELIEILIEKEYKKME
ncbi:hypothetical protein [Pectobacterium versatile]|nr:hypothetical protein [Pectobacterium versatile]